MNESLSESSDGRAPAQSVPGPAVVSGQHRFNDDLLLNDGDLEHAREQFPAIFHAIDHPELRAAFRRFDAEANRAREWVRITGLASVVGTTVALLIAVVVAAAHEPSHDGARGAWAVDLLLAAVEVTALLCAAVAAGGMWLGPWKRRWLENRIATERLRQWHFQMLVRRVDALKASCDPANPQAREEFVRRRSVWFRDFLHSLAPETLRAELTDEAAEVNPWLHPPSGRWEPGNEVFASVCEAYGVLRFDHQCNYAVYKLRRDADEPFWRFLKWPAAAQQRFVERGWSFCFVLALLCSALIIVAHSLLLVHIHVMEPMLGSMYIVAVGSAILGMGLRAAEDGLGVAGEIRRLGRYGHMVRSLRSVFQNDGGDAGRLRCMERMEAAVFDEMRDFIRIHNEARFVI